jgi:Chromosome segregation protein Csm1/Pcs1
MFIAQLMLTFTALRFNLCVEDPANASGTSSFDEIQMTYTPLLDEKNDQHLLDILEDYLVEDICFPRNHAQGFYTKVRECMVRKVVMED